MPVCLETSTRDPLPVKSSTMFEEMVYFYFGERVTLKTVSLQTDTRLKKKKIFRIQKLHLQKMLNNFKELSKLYDLIFKD